MMPLTLTLTLIKQAVRNGFKPLSLFFVPPITGLSAKLALIALIATTPFIASGETVYNHHEKIEVALPPSTPYPVLLDQQIAMGPVSSIDSIRIDMGNPSVEYAYDLDVNYRLAACRTRSRNIA
jgi:hypothetical protein